MKIVSFRHLAAGLFAVAIAMPVAPAAGWDVDPRASDGALEAFHDHFSLAAYPFPRHSAKPLGTLGFDIWADVVVAPDFEDEVRTAVDGDLPGGYLGIYRIGARKGLPFGLDVGASWGQAVDGEIDLISGELSWALLEGGVATPALGLRATGSFTSGSDAYDLEQYGLEAELSKGFAVLTPFVGAGIVWSESTFERAARGEIAFDSTETVFYGGVIVNLLVPKLTVAVEQGEDLQGAVRIAFGL